VLLGAVKDGVALLTWEQDSFALADSFDESAGRYRGLRWGQMVAVSEDGTGLLVKPDVAKKQIEAEKQGPTTGTGATGGATGSSSDGGTTTTSDSATGASGGPPTLSRPRRFHGTVTLDPTRVGRDAGRIADEVIAHLAGLVGSSVTVMLEIEAEVSAGVPENVVRTVTENSRTLKFGSHGFEKE
jgi:hypothetical protein